MQVGHVSQLWRYPVKSMGEEQRSKDYLGENGIPGDRAWAVRDERSQQHLRCLRIGGGDWWCKCWR
jgi:MOSC domain-containing protein